MNDLAKPLVVIKLYTRFFLKRTINNLCLDYFFYHKYFNFNALVSTYALSPTAYRE